ncbi:MAG TPA: hypothetical protein VFC00_30945 [Micromonosporaceae bacterium]|nr:hypothetical protein [Micromonosporaceae bacterium]
MTDLTLFDAAPYAVPAAEVEPVEKLSADRRRTLRQATALAAGRHPLTRGRLHPDAAPHDDRQAPGARCGTCRFREVIGYHNRSYGKCLWPDVDGDLNELARVTHGAYPRERTTEIADMAVTGNTPEDAMCQISAHAESLYEWHQVQAERNEPAPPLTPEEVNARIGKAFAQLTAGARAYLIPKPPAAEQPAEPATDEPGQVCGSGSPIFADIPFGQQQPSCTRPPRHRGPHGDGKRTWRNYGLDLDDEPGQEGAEAEDDPAFTPQETEAAYDAAVAALRATRAQGGIVPGGVVYSTGGDHGPEAKQ